MFSKTEWRNFVDTYKDTIEPGEVRRRNHYSPHCSGDSKSMEIKGLENGDIRIRCFRCGNFGYIKKKGTPRIPKRTSEYKVPKALYIPSECTISFPFIIEQWIEKYINLGEARGNGICYRPSTDAVVFPVFHKETLVGWQERHFNPRMPKYTTTTIDKAKMFWTGGVVDHHTLVIVEDILSAIKVGRYYSSLALLGTKLNDHIMLACSERQKVVVWLDNDNKQVRMRSLEIANRLRSVVSNVIVVMKEGNPKESDMPDIEYLVGDR